MESGDRFPSGVHVNLGDTPCNEAIGDFILYPMQGTIITRRRLPGILKFSILKTVHGFTFLGNFRILSWKAPKIESASMVIISGDYFLTSASFRLTAWWAWKAKCGAFSFIYTLPSKSAEKPGDCSENATVTGIMDLHDNCSLPVPI